MPPEKPADGSGGRPPGHDSRLQAEQLETLNRVLQTLTATLDLEAVLEVILTELQKVIPYDSAAIFQIRGHHLELLSGRGFPNYAMLQGARFHLEDPDSPTSVVSRTNAPHIVDDAPKVYGRFQQPPYDESRTHGWLGVPLLYGHRQIGMLTLDKHEAHFYQPQHARLAEAFASQAAIAIENARLFETERSARAQAEALQSATTALSATLELPHVLDVILTELQRVVPYDSAAVHEIKNSHRLVIAGRGFPNYDLTAGLTFNLTPEEDPVGYIVVQTRKPLIVDDVLTHYPNFNTGPHEQTGTRGWLGVPMLFGDKLVGIITIDKRQPDFYTEAHGRTALAYATQAAIAIENARLFAAVNESLRREQHLKEVANSLTSSLDLPTILQNFVRLATELVGAQSGVLALLTSDRLQISFPHHHNVPADIALSPQSRRDDLVWRVLDDGQPLLSVDYGAEAGAWEAWVRAGAHGFIGVPIAGADVIGALCLFDCDAVTHFSSHHMDLAAAIGKQASVAIQNAWHFEVERLQGLRQAALFRLSANLASARTDVEIWQGIVYDLYDEQLGYQLLLTAEFDAVTGDRVVRSVCSNGEVPIPDRLVRGRGLSERPMHDGKLHYTPDVRREPAYEPGFQTGSEADLPIFVDNQIVGVLAVQNARAHAFSQADLDVLTAAAHQAGLALGRARLLVETQQRLGELATVNAISQAAASRREPAALLDIVGDEVYRSFRAHMVYIALVDKAAQIIKVPYCQYRGERLENITFNLGEGLTSVVLRTKQPLLISENYVERAPAFGALSLISPRTRQEPLTWLAVPIMTGDEAIGVISVQDYERENAFTDSDVRLLTTIAANLGIAVRNAQLYAASEQRAAELNAALVASRTLTSSLDLTTVLDAILDAVYGLQDGLESVDVFLYRNGELSFGSAAYAGGARRSQPVQAPRPDGITYTVARSGEPIYIADIERAPRFHAPGWVGAIQSLPLKMGARVVGVMNISYLRPKAFGESELRVVRLLADQAAIAIENARLYEASQLELAERARAEERLRQANERLHTHIAEIEALQTQLHEQAVRDPLTALFNRRYLEETLERELSRAGRERAPVSIVMIDIDHFKAVNDSYGHRAGDLMLQALGRLLLTQTRRGDIACRYGGEEFIIIMPGASLETARQRAEGWRAAFGRLDVGRAPAKVRATLSIGVAMFPDHGESSEEILRAADLALYASKAAGRNSVVVFELPL